MVSGAVKHHVIFTDIQNVEFMYLVFTCMPGESYRWRLRSLLLYFCCIFQALINPRVCWFCTSAQDLVLFQIKLKFFSCLIRGCNHSHLLDFPCCWDRVCILIISQFIRLGYIFFFFFFFFFFLKSAMTFQCFFIMRRHITQLGYGFRFEKSFIKSALIGHGVFSRQGDKHLTWTRFYIGEKFYKECTNFSQSFLNPE